jgi:glutathione S-transferase
MAPTSNNEVHLFDILSTLSSPKNSWSVHILKIRCILNYKKIPYSQSFISYPDIAPLLKSLDVPPHKSGTPYTLPAILHNDSIASNANGALADSLPIALHLDAVFPDPPLFPSGHASYALYLAVERITAGFESGYRPFIVPRVAENLDPRGKVYFEETRSAALGKPLAQVRPGPEDTERSNQLWAIIEREALVLSGMLRGREGKQGVFLEGETLGFADILVACHLAFIERFDKELFARVVGLGGGELLALYEAFVPLLEGQGVDKRWDVPDGNE